MNACFIQMRCSKRHLSTTGKRIIIAHNHPSGELSPSHEDIKLTKHMVRGRVSHEYVPVLDHLIIGNGDFNSIRQSTDIWEELEQAKEDLLTPPKKLAIAPSSKLYR